MSKLEIKIYTRTLKLRLRSIVERGGWLREVQGGFRDKRSTLDLLFVPSRQCRRKGQSNKKKRYFAFIDYKKL